jgi:hypothetical protein
MTKDNPSPKHGSTTDTPGSISQPDGTAADAPRGETKEQPNPRGETQAQPNSTNANAARVNSQTPENRTGQLNPSAPTEATEGGHVTEQLVSEGPSTMDEFGQVGHPSGKGTLEIDERTVSTGDNPTSEKPGPEGTGQPRREENREEEEESAA